MERERLFLIDGTSLAYRAHFALLRGGRGPDGQRPSGLTNRDGKPTGAVFGFIGSLRKLLADHRPHYAGIAFDTAAPTARHEAYADYKANREPMPPDLVSQLPWIFRAAEALRIPLVTHEGWEADDVLGTLARKAVAAGLDVVLVTLDKDMYQLLGPHVSMLQLRTETRLVRAEDLPQEFGVRPDQVVDVLALWGDPSDNIPGVAGIGEKGAKSLVAEWGSLDRIYANLDRVKPGLRARLEAGRDSALLSRELATIRTDLDIPFDLVALRVDPPDRDKLHALASELDFRSLARETAPVADTEAGPVDLLADEAALAGFLARLRDERALALEPLPTPGSPMSARLVGLGLALPSGPVAYLPLAHRDSAALADARFAALAGPVLADPGVRKIGGDLKRARLLLHRHGCDLAGLAEDVGLCSYLLDPGRSSHAVDLLAGELLGAAPPPLAAPPRGEDARAVPALAAAEAIGGRARAAARLAPRLLAELEAQGLAALYRDVELPLLLVLSDMEETGIRLDTAQLAAQAAEIEGRLAALTSRIHELAGVTFNVNSPRQLGEILFEKLNLPVLKKTRKSRAASTDTEVLEELARSFELPRLVLEHRELSKLKGTYIEALPALVDPTTGRLHTTWQQTVAATGRLSSADPNLQNIPVRSEEGRRIRAAFVADPGMRLVVADYSQIELRLLAHFSGDPELTQAFRDGADVHTRTAASVFGVAEALVTPELRRRAKAVNFGILYGQSAFGLSRELGIGNAEAQKLIDEYFRRYAGVRAWLDRTIAEARASGEVRTLFGRRRRLPEIASENRSAREYAERTATNTPLQGTAADLIKIAMVRVAARLAREQPQARLLLQVHDELVLECPEDEAGEVGALVRAEMEGAAALCVPLVVEVGSGRNWLEAK